jgi:hypothetical protein
MSKYSGKCDFYDVIEIHGIDKILNSRVFVGDEEVFLKSEKDCIKYYPYVVSTSHTDKDGGTFHLTDRSWVDIEEEGMLKIYLNIFVRYFNKCKRNNIEYKIEDAVKQTLSNDEKAVLELANRVKDNGKKATYEGVHLKLYDYYRNLLNDKLKEVDNI